ncbi:conjugal transfer protein TraF [Aliivibrio fischeri]|uniref:conjugal transfer protein TraF n=1 Tax=Aliivibrio fischeri TaxID=668 RepID=UPI003080B04D
MMLTKVQKVFSKIPSDPTGAAAADIENGLRNLNVDALSFSMGAGMAVAIPNRIISMAFYGKTSVEGITLPDVDALGLPADPAKPLQLADILR